MKRIVTLLIPGFIISLLVFAMPSHAYSQLTKRYADTLVIPFAHKQSAIFHKYTLDVLDSVVNILNMDTAIKLSIEGYSYIDEGNDTICKYLSLNRALFIQDAIFGRGIDSGRILSLKAMAQWKPSKRGKYIVNSVYPYRVELLMIYPPPPKKIVIADKDMDGLADEEDDCPDKFGYPENKGCPQKDVYLVIFENTDSYLTASGFNTLDKIIQILKDNPSFTITIAGHASRTEGTTLVSDRLSRERSETVVRYLASRFVPLAKIAAINNYGKLKPVNAQQNPRELYENSSTEIILHKNIN